MLAGENATSLAITRVYVSFNARASGNIRYFANYKLITNYLVNYIRTIEVNIFLISPADQSDFQRIGE